jgi:histidinol-phosphate aminotransferase
MSQLNKIIRPLWITQKPRKISKLWLDKNENTHPKLQILYKRILKKINPIHISSYPDLGGLYKKISFYEKIPSENIIFSHGSDGCIKNIFDAFTQKNQKVITLSPTFAMYDIYPKIYNLKHLTFDYNFSRKAPSLDLQNLINKVKSEKPKLLCIANPNSPTGTIIKKKNILELIKTCHKFRCKLLIDEAYYGFCKETSKKFVKKYDNIFIIRSLSKAWGLAGLRLGYIISNKKNIELLNKIRPMYEINTFGAEFLKLLLDKKYLTQLNLILNDMINAKYNFLKFLKENKFEYFSSYGNFIHFKIKHENKKNVIKELSKLSYFRLSESHKCLKDYCRITLTSSENIDKIIKIIKQ